MQDFDQLSAEGIGASVLTDMLAGNFLDDNPMHFQAMMKSQKRTVPTLSEQLFGILG